MAVFISIFLMLSCLFLCVSTICDLKLTVQQYNAFAGVDPTKHCGCADDIKNECIKIGKAIGFTDGKTDFLSGFPYCTSKATGIFQDCSGGTVLKHISVLVCMWSNNRPGEYLILGKGQAANHVMNYVGDDKWYLHPCKDYQYNGN